MKKFLLIACIALSSLNTQAQKGAKVGYIDMDYILEKTPSYADAKNKLEQKANSWKQEIEAKKAEIKNLQDALNKERVVLTKELIAEREEEIQTLTKELLDHQDKRFGPKGDLMIQRATLVKPIQDQVFNVVQDIAEQRSYDLIFDKSSDLTILFASKRFDVSDIVLRTLLRTEKKENLSKKEEKKQEVKDKEIDDRREDPSIAVKEKAAEDKKDARQKIIDDRKAAADARRQELLDKRNQMIKERQEAAEKRRLDALEKREALKNKNKEKVD